MTLSSINSCKKYEDEAEADPCLSVVQEDFQKSELTGEKFFSPSF